MDFDSSNLLSPARKRDVCLYIFRILFTPNLLGMKYLDTGEKHLVPFSFIRGSCLRYAVVCTIVYSIAGALLAGFLGNVAVLWLGIESLRNTSTAGYGFLAGIALAWWYVLRLALEYVQARAD